MNSLRDRVYPLLEEVMRVSTTLPLSGTVVCFVGIPYTGKFWRDKILVNGLILIGEVGSANLESFVSMSEAN